MSLGFLALGLCMRVLLDREHRDLDLLRGLGNNRRDFLTRLFLNVFFAIGTFMNLGFALQNGWNEQRVITVLGYSLFVLVQAYFTFKIWAIRRDLTKTKQ